VKLKKWRIKTIYNKEEHKSQTGLMPTHILARWQPKPSCAILL